MNIVIWYENFKFVRSTLCPNTLITMGTEFTAFCTLRPRNFCRVIECKCDSVINEKYDRHHDLAAYGS